LSTKHLLPILASIPRILLALAGYLLGSTFWLFPTKKRRITYINLHICLPKLTAWQRHQLARRSLINEAQTLLEIPAIMKMSVSTVQRVIEVSGKQHLQEAFNKSRGVILAIPHLGNWEMIGMYGSLHYPMTSLYRPQHRSPELDQFIRSGRQRFGAKLVPTDTSGVRALYKALTANELVAILPDQKPAPGAGVFAPFFGRPAYTMILLSRLAQRQQSTVLFCYTERLSWGRGFKLHLIPADKAVADKDPIQAATALNQGIEKCINANPSQYWWSYKRFNTATENQPTPYAK